MAATAIRLFERTEALEILNDWLEESRGELTPAIEQLLAEAEGDFDEKAERVALYIREQIAGAAAIREEETRLHALRMSKERAAENLKRYLLLNMQQAERTKVEGTLVTVRVQKSPPAVESSLSEGELDALFGIAPRFVRLIPQRFELDKRAVLEAYKLGQVLPRGVDVTQGTSLRIG